MTDRNTDPLFAPLSARPKDEAERHKRRITESASHAGKTWRGTRTGHSWSKWWPHRKPAVKTDA